MTFEDLLPILNERGISPMQFAQEVGISPQVITNAKKRGTHFSAATMGKITKYLEKDKIAETDLTNKEMDLLKSWRSLDEEHQRMIVEMIAFYKSKKQD